MGMGTYWPSKKRGNKPHHIARPAKASQTPGRQKGETCKADKLKKYMARSSRSYKHPLYGEWCRKMDILNNRKTG
jgi:hypothetical protein